MNVPKGFEKFHLHDVALLLLKTCYGLKQATFEHWRALPQAINALGMTQSKADPCMHFK